MSTLSNHIDKPLKANTQNQTPLFIQILNTPEFVKAVYSNTNIQGCIFMHNTGTGQLILNGLWLSYFYLYMEQNRHLDMSDMIQNRLVGPEVALIPGHHLTHENSREDGRWGGSTSRVNK